jgi:hypothetical protein
LGLTGFEARSQLVVADASPPDKRVLSRDKDKPPYSTSGTSESYCSGGELWKRVALPSLPSSFSVTLDSEMTGLARGINGYSSTVTVTDVSLSWSSSLHWEEGGINDFSPETLARHYSISRSGSSRESPGSRSDPLIGIRSPSFAVARRVRMSGECDLDRLWKVSTPASVPDS